MKFLVGKWGLVLWIGIWLALASANQNEAEDGDESEEDYINFTVNRVKSSDAEGDSLDDDHEYEEYDYYLNQLGAREREMVEKEPYRRLSKWKQGWRRYPLYVIILGG